MTVFPIKNPKSTIIIRKSILRIFPPMPLIHPAHKNMKFNIPCAALILAVISPVLAEEGGAGRYVPGNAATLIDLPPTKAGWVFESIYLHYDGDASASKSFSNAAIFTGITLNTENDDTDYQSGQRRLEGDYFWLKLVYQF